MESMPVKAIPSPMGGSTGTYFFAYQDAHVHGFPQGTALFMVSQDEPSNVKVIKMDTGETMAEEDLDQNELWFLTSDMVNFIKEPIMVTSTNDIMVIAGNMYTMDPIPVNMWDDTTIVGVRPDDPTTFFVISRAVAFSPAATAKVTIGGLEITIPKGQYTELPSGLVTLSSNATLIVEIISMPSSTFPGSGESKPIEVLALTAWGTYLLSAEGVELEYPEPVVGPTDGGEEAAGGDITLYLAAGVAAVVVVAALLLWKKPWK